MIMRESAVPPWRQIAGHLRDQIERGELPPGTRLPPILALAADYGVAAVTVRKALAELREEGLITSVSGWGTFVSGNGTPSPPKP